MSATARDRPLARWAAPLAVAAACGLGLPAHAVGQAEPTRDCCRELRSLYEATILRIDVMRLRVEVDSVTASAAEALIRGAARSSGLEREVALRYRTAREATIEMEFLIGTSGKTFVSGTLEALRGLVADRVLTPGQLDAVEQATTARFAFLEGAGVEDSDRLRYRIAGDTLWTTWRRGDAVLTDERVADRLLVDVILATFFAPSSDFRKGLLDSAFRP